MKKILFLISFLVLLIGCQEQAQQKAVLDIAEPEINVEVISEEPNIPVEDITEVNNKVNDTKKEVVIELGYNSLIPKEMIIDKGTRVIWKNVDDILQLHNIAGTNMAFRSGKLTYGESYSYIFTNTGTFNYIDYAYKEEERDQYMGTIVVR